MLHVIGLVLHTIIARLLVQLTLTTEVVKLSQGVVGEISIRPLEWRMPVELVQ